MQKKIIHFFYLIGGLKSIETDFFINFPNLKTLILELYNFTSLIRPENMKWLGHLKSLNYSNGTNNDLVVHLFDRSNLFQYTNDDFCTFAHFSPALPIYPVIRTRPKLDCSSCTLTWLLKNWRLHKQRYFLNK